MSFLTELTDLINKYSIENESFTPDFILAEYTRDCLTAFATATQKRVDWNGKEKEEPYFIKGRKNNIKE